MPLSETEAIVLRTYRLAEADKIVSLLTRHRGRLRAVASGAQRPKSRFGGTLEPLTYCRLWLYERENRDLARLNSTDLLESFFAMQSDYRLQIASQYVAEVSEALLPEREVNEPAFRLLLSVLRGMKRSREADRPLVYFNYWMLRLGGFLPELDRCSQCGNSLAGGPGSYRPWAPGLFCQNCAADSSGRKLSAATLGFVAGIKGSSLETWMVAGAPPESVVEARRFFEGLLELHSEHRFHTRELLANARSSDALT